MSEKKRARSRLGFTAREESTPSGGYDSTSIFTPEESPIKRRSPTKQESDDVIPLGNPEYGLVGVQTEKNIYFILDFDGVVSVRATAFLNFVNNYYSRNFKNKDKDYNKINREAAAEVVEKYFEETNEDKFDWPAQKWVLEVLLPKLRWPDGSNLASIYSGNGVTLVEAFMRKILGNTNDEAFQLFFRNVIGEIDEKDLNTKKLERLALSNRRRAPKLGMKKRLLSYDTGEGKILAKIDNPNARYKAVSVGNSVFNIGGSKAHVFANNLIGTRLYDFLVYVDDSESQADAFVKTYVNVAKTNSLAVRVIDPVTIPGTDEKVRLVQIVADAPNATVVPLAHVWHTPPPYWLGRTYQIIIDKAKSVARGHPVFDFSDDPPFPVTEKEREDYMLRNLDYMQEVSSFSSSSSAASSSSSSSSSSTSWTDSNAFSTPGTSMNRTTPAFTPNQYVTTATDDQFTPITNEGNWLVAPSTGDESSFSTLLSDDDGSDSTPLFGGGGGSPLNKSPGTDFFQ